MGEPGAFSPNPTSCKKPQLITSHWDPPASVAASQSAKAFALIPRSPNPRPQLASFQASVWSEEGGGVTWGRRWGWRQHTEPLLTSHHRMMAAPGWLWEVVQLENFPIFWVTTGSTRECSRNYSRVLNRNRLYKNNFENETSSNLKSHISAFWLPFGSADSIRYTSMAELKPPFKSQHVLF